MASETVVLPDQTTPTPTPTTTTAVEHVEETTSPNVLIIESQERTEDNKIHQPAVEKADNSPYLAAPAVDSAVVTEDTNSKPAVSSVSEIAAEDVGKDTVGQTEISNASNLAVESAEIPIHSAPGEESAVVTEDTDSKLADSSVSELAVEDVGKETEGQTEISNPSNLAVESVEIPVHSAPTQEPGAEVETKPEELVEHESKVVEKPQAVAEEPQFGKEPEESEYKEVENSFSIVEESEIGKKLEVAESDPKVVEKPEKVVEAEPEPQKPSEDVEVTEEKHDKLEPEVILAADEGILISKDNDVIESTTKKETGEGQEPFADKSSDALVSETPSDPIDKDVSIIPDGSDEAPRDNTQKEDVWSDTVENFAKGTPSEVSKVEEQNDVKDEKLAEHETTTADEERNVKNEKVAEPEATTAEDVGDATAAEVSEKSFEGASGNVKIDTEEKKEETFKDDTAAPVQTIEDTEPIASKPEEVHDTSSVTEALKVSENDEVVTEEKKEKNVESDNASVETTHDIVPQASEDKEVDYSNSAPEVVEKKDENVKADAATPVETIADIEPMASKTDEGGVDTTSATEVTEKFVDERKASKDVEVTEEKVEDVKRNTALAEITKDTVPQASEPKEVDYSNSAAEVAEKMIEEEKASTEDVVTDEKKQENVKDSTVSSLDSAKGTVLEGETNVSSTTDTSSGEPKELVLERRGIDIAESKEDKNTAEAEVAETISISDTPNLDSSNDSKANEDLSKTEVPTKPVQKHSHGILSKVKHSIGKVKKAITGKSPTSKNSTSDAKGDDVKVKEGTN